MKSLIRNTAINAVGLGALSALLSGVKISGGLPTFVLGGAILSFMSLIVKPIINLITLPLNLVTFGSFSIVTNAIILYLLVVIVPQISINAFVFSGYSFAGFVMPRFSFNLLFAYIISAVTFSLIVSFINWLIKN